MGAGKAVFVKDQKPKRTKYKKFTDDGVLKLHPARFNGLPTGNPEDWAGQVPVKKTQIMKNIYMTNYGLRQGQVDIKVIVKLQDRRVAVEIDELCKGTSLRGNTDMAEVWRLKEGAFNYINIMHKLWPTDAGAQIIYKVLEDARWAAVAADDRKLRANMIRQLFNEMTEENAGRAVIMGQPLTYLEGWAKWKRLLEREFPNTGNMGAATKAGSSGKYTLANNKKLTKGSSSGGQPSGAGGPIAGPSGGGGAGRSGGGGSGGVARGSGLPFNTPIPRFNGLSVCWEFNKGGCTRQALSATTCKNPGSPSIFAHVCNAWDAVAKTHCYGAHSRMEPGRH